MDFFTRLFRNPFFIWFLAGFAISGWVTAFSTAGAYFKVKNYVKVPATLSYSEKSEGKCQFVYDYKVDNITYEGTRSNTWARDDVSVCDYLEKMSAIHQLHAFYDPHSPDKSILDNRLQHSMFADSVFLGTAFMAPLLIDMDVRNMMLMNDGPITMHFGNLNGLAALCMFWSSFQPSIYEGPIVSYFLQGVGYAAYFALSYGLATRSLSPAVYSQYTNYALIALVVFVSFDRTGNYAEFMPLQAVKDHVNYLLFVYN